MPSKFSVYGAGGTPRTVTKFGIYGAGGVLRNVLKAWVYGAAGTPRLFFDGNSGFQLTAGDIIGVSKGYQQSPLTGSVVPSPAFISGMEVTLLVSSNGSNIIRLTTFSPTNPGQLAFNTLTIAPLWFGNAADAAYSYSATTATWDWTTTSKMVVGNTYTVSVT
jgi:hypothetical protein